jgi:hypothetical protein
MGHSERMEFWFLFPVLTKVEVDRFLGIPGKSWNLGEWIGQTTGTSNANSTEHYKGAAAAGARRRGHDDDAAVLVVRLVVFAGGGQSKS